ncbi:MAG: hypothetical protein ACP5IZ_10360 [Thermoprotei archaeon]
MGLKVEILAPPNSSILSSMLYEGLLRIKSKCSDDINIQCLKELWEKLLEEKRGIIFNFVGNDIKNTLRSLSKKYNTQITDFKSFVNFMKNIHPQDLIIDVKITPDKEFLVGNRLFTNERKGEGYAFQIMKIDRYQGITSMELNLINEQVTVYADISGLYMFFLGLLSSYITTTERDYYFLFFDTSILPFALEKPEKWIDIKEKVSKDLKNVLNKIRSANDEIITLSVLLNALAVESIKEQNLTFTSLRLVRVTNEGNTYKVYNDIPLEIFVNQKIYKNEKTLENLQEIMNQLINPASRFINGNDKDGDGYHAYLALKYLYSYVITGNSEHLQKFYRELHEADKIKPSQGYLRWVSQKLI